MTYDQLIQAVAESRELRFIDAEGMLVPAHAHLTEVALVRKHFIDCGGVERREEHVSVQLFVAGDTDHRLEPSKLAGILRKAQRQLGLRNEEVLVEYQLSSLSTFGLDFDGMAFHLKPMFTNCLASDSCGIPLQELPQAKASACSPNSGCC